MKIKIFDTTIPDELRALESFLASLNEGQLVQISTAGAGWGASEGSTTYHWVTVIWKES